MSHRKLAQELNFPIITGFHTHVKKRYSNLDSPEPSDCPTEQVKKYNEVNKAELASSINSQVANICCLVACADAFRRRVHSNLKQSGDIVVVDGMSNIDLSDAKLFRFITCSPAEGLPLGWIVCKFLFTTSFLFFLFCFTDSR